MDQINRRLKKLEENAPERHNLHTRNVTLLLVAHLNRVPGRRKSWLAQRFST
jgi:hypothetical protein